MKLLRLLVLQILTVVAAQAQFEGKIVWALKMELAEAGLASQADVAKARLSSPEIQNQLAEARKAMESPEMKAMIEQNPQMKAMMESQLAMLAPQSAPTGAAAGAMAGFFPTSITLFVKGADTLTKAEGGMMPLDELSLGEKDTVYQIDRTKKTFQKLPANTAVKSSSDVSGYKVRKTSETKKILGYVCTRYEVQGKADESETFTVWAAPEVKGLSPKLFRSMRMGDSADADFLAQVDGVPLRIDVAQPQARVTMEITEIKAETLPATLFTLPHGFIETAPTGAR